jgi:RNA recognition motif-containing protein
VERKDARAPKSNTRNARTGDSDPREKRPEGDRPPREPRAPREGGRSGDRPRGGDPKSVESTRVYVGNLSYDVTEQDLQELFKGIGGVRNVEIVYNRSTHRSKGYGFVEMLRMDEAIRAVEVLNDQFFMGRKMTVSGAKSKGQDEREDKDERPAREPKPVVVASTSAAEVAAVEASEPGIEGVVESAASPEAALEGESVAPAVSAVEVNDLEAKDGSEPEEKASDAPSH